MQKLIIAPAVLTGIFCWSNYSLAACWLTSSVYTTAAVATPLEGSISVTPDMPVGTHLGSLIKNNNRGTAGSLVKIDCTTTQAFYYRYNVSGLVNSGVMSGGKTIYRTSYPGIGVWVPSEALNKLESMGYLGSSYSRGAPSFAMEFYKIGDIAPGVFDGSTLPAYTQSIGHSNSMVQIGGMRPTGSITITAPTCTTPDVLVDMGDWSVGTFAGKNSGTVWRDASIQLTNCGQFHGNRITIQRNLDGTSVITPRPNTWTLSLTPLYGTEDAANGIMKIDSSSGSASGVGIQVGYGSTASAGSNLVNFLVDKTDNLPMTGDTTINIPLAARYVQTEDTITGGRADSKATFTISYK